MNTRQKLQLSTIMVLAGLGWAVSGCAGLPDTADQVVRVDSSPRVPSAHCIMSNANGVWSVWNVPSTVSILRDSHPLVITCKATGWQGQITVAAHPNLEVAFIGQTSGTIAETSDALPPPAPYQANPSNKFDGIFQLYPGTVIVPMHRDPAGWP